MEGRACGALVRRKGDRVVGGVDGVQGVELGSSARIGLEIFVLELINLLHDALEISPRDHAYLSSEQLSDKLCGPIK